MPKAIFLKLGSFFVKNREFLPTLVGLALLAPGLASAANLTVSGLVAAGKVYDGSTNITVSFSGAALNGVAPGDVGNVTLVTNGYYAGFADKNVGNGKTVTVGGLSLTGSASSGYTLIPPVLSANITTRPLHITAAGVNKTYDATINASVTLSDDKLAGDDVQDFYDLATFLNKNVGTNKTVQVSDIFVIGVDSDNYAQANTTATTTANISSKTLRAAAVGQSKSYDGGVLATVTFGDNHLAGDSVAETAASATFADPYVGTGKSISISGITASGPDAANYTLSTTTGHAQANITPKALNVTASGNSKTYDGTANATVSMVDDRLGTDNITVTFSSASFNNKNAGTNKTVTVYDLFISGPDSDSYTPATANATTTANISSRNLTVVAFGVNKPYDGTTNMTVTLGDNRVTGDSLTENYTSAGAANKNVGAGKPVAVFGISVSGSDAVNYSLSATTAATTAKITPHSLTVTAVGQDKVYDGTTNATVTLGDNRVAGDNLTDSYTSASFADKNAGNGKSINVTGIQVTGSDAANYTVSGTTASATANITGRPLIVAATGQDKIYDGTTNATATLSDNRLAGDSVTTSFASAGFTDKNVGSGKTVGLSGLTLGGANASNYTLANSNATTIASITTRPLSVTATGSNKVYNGTTAATVTLADNRVAGDSFTAGYGSANFLTSSAGNNKTINILGIYLTGTDAGNYLLGDTTATATANITARSVASSLASSGNPSGYHDALGFTETLPADATGTVTFLTNGTTFASGSVSGGAVSSGTITNLPRGTNVITAIYGGDNNYSGVTDTLSQIVTNHPPITGIFNFSETNGLSLKVRISDLLSAVLDPDADPVSLVSIGISTNGMVSPTNATFILFRNTNYLNDQFSYLVTDNFGGYATGRVSVVSVIAPFTGQSATMAPIGGLNTLTFHGLFGFTYVTQRSVDTVNWVNISTNTAPANGIIVITDHFTDLGGPPASAFYRLKWVP